jgi:hypothetical protein
MEALIANCSAELIEAPFIQNIDQMRAGTANMPAIHTELDKLLHALLGPQSAS